MQRKTEKMKLGANIGVGVSYETSKKFVYASGIDFLLTAGGYAAMSDYLSNGSNNCIPIC